MSVPQQAVPLDMMFEPTGILLKDYNAYCEVDGLLERDDLIDAVSYAEVSDPVSGTKKLRTRFTLRNPPRSNLLPQRDFLPMAKAIPHCNTLDVLHLTGVGVTDVCVRNLADAVFKSPSITSVTVDFNSSNGLCNERPNAVNDTERPLITEISVNGTQFRNGILSGLENEATATGGKRDDYNKKKSASSSMPTGAKAKAQAAREAEELERNSQPISIPQGWSALCFSGIQHLCLRGNKINDGDVAIMASYLEEPFSDLRCLNLWGNEITDAGAKDLAHAIAVGRRITAIDLGQNRIGDSGFESFARLFLTSDCAMEEAQRLRARTLMVLNTSGPVAPTQPPAYDPLPSMPSFLEIFASNGDDGTGGASGDEASSSAAAASGGGTRSGGEKNVRGSTPRSKMSRAASSRDDMGGGGRTRSSGGKRGEQFSISDRSRVDFDRDLVRLDDPGQFRVPGCCQIVCLSLAHNPPATDRGVLAFERVLRTQEPSRSDEASMMVGSNTPSQYCSTLNLNRLEIGNTNISDTVMNKLQLAMQKVVARRSSFN